MRIALILPKHRLWHWHRRLIDQLGRSHAVTVFFDDRAPPYARLLRAWLRVELAVCRDRSMTWSDIGDGTVCSKLKERDFDLIVDLAEHGHPSRKSMAIRYNGALSSTALVECLLARRTPHLTICRGESNQPLAQSRIAIDDGCRLSRGLQLVFARCISLVDRSVGGVFDTGGERDVERAAAQPSASTSLPAHIGRFIVEKTLGRFRRANHWSIALRRGSGPFMMVADDAKRFYGDPFLFAWQGRTFVFVEEFPYATRKGVISVAEVVGDRLVDVPVPVLERPYHLSYPCVLAEGDSIYMLPETAANNTLELYRAVDFPWKWQLDRVLIERLPLADATPLFHQGRWWVFAAAAEHGATDHDELFLFYSDRLTGPWRPHSRNPVKSDCRGARPAGRIIRQGGRLLRPAQDCEEGYGTGVVWQEIIELTPSSFHEREIAYWGGQRDLGVAGIHSFDQVGRLQVIDLKRPIGLGARPAHSFQLAPRIGSAMDLGIPIAAPDMGVQAMLQRKGEEQLPSVGGDCPTEVERSMREADLLPSRHGARFQR